MVIDCHHCNATVEPVPPAKKWRVWMVLAAVVLLGLAPLYGGIIGGIMGLSILLVPVILAMGMMVGPIARLMTTWTCPECKAEVHTPERIRSASASRLGRLWRALHAA